MDTIWLIELGLLGMLVGFLSALLGVSGGLMLVPVLYWLLPKAGIAAQSVPLVAAASALAAMVPTTASAAFAQRRHRQVDRAWMRRMAPGLLAGSVAGALLASHVSAIALTLAFLAYAVWFAVSLQGKAAAPAAPTIAGRCPAWGIGGLIGAVSAVVGGGGTNLVVAYLMSRDIGMHRAIGTGRLVGLLLTVGASAAFAMAATVAHSRTAQFAAAGAAGLHLLGVIHWPSAVIAGLCGTATAPYGVRLALRLPAHQLRRGFAVATVGMALVMLARMLAAS